MGPDWKYGTEPFTKEKRNRTKKKTNKQKLNKTELVFEIYP